MQFSLLSSVVALLLEINMNHNVQLEYSQPLLISRSVSVKYPLDTPEN